MRIDFKIKFEIEELLSLEFPGKLIEECFVACTGDQSRTTLIGDGGNIVSTKHSTIIFFFGIQEITTSF